MLLGLEMDRPPPSSLSEERALIHEGRVGVEGGQTEEAFLIASQVPRCRVWPHPHQSSVAVGQTDRASGAAQGGGGHQLAIGVAKDKLLRLYNFPESLQFY